MGVKNHTDITAGAPAQAAVFNAPLGQLDDALADALLNFGDYVVTGGLPSVPAGLVITQPAARAFIQGGRVSASATTLTAAVSSDNYVDLDTAGLFHLTAVANNAAAPPAFANSTRLYRLITNATGGVSIADLRAQSPLSNILGTFINVKASPYLAKGDGITDDTAAIQAALNAAGAGTVPLVGGLVWLPRGTYMISARLIVPNRVALVGSGRDATTILALGSFPVSTELVRLGDIGTSAVFGCRIENMTVDCNNIAGTTSIYSERINEQSGVFRCLAKNYVAFGIRINNPGTGTPAQQYSIDDVECYAGSSAGAGGIGLAANCNPRFISRVTSINQFVKSTTAIQLDAVTARISDIHVENATNGVLVGSVNACGGSVFENITGHSDVTNLMVWSNATAQNPLTAMGLVPNGATNTLVDQGRSNTMSGFAVDLYAVGIGSVGTQVILTTDNGITQVLGTTKMFGGLSPATIGGATQASRLFMGTGVPSGGSAGDWFMRTDGGGAGATHLYFNNAGTWLAVA